MLEQTIMCRHIYDWNIVECDVKQPIHLTSLTWTDQTQTRWRRGSRLAYGSGDPGSIPTNPPSNEEEVKTIFRRTCAHVGIGSAR